MLEIYSDQVTHTSDHFDKLYQYAIEIIEKGFAYVDDTDVETVSNKYYICKILLACKKYLYII